MGDWSACGANVLNFCRAQQQSESAICFFACWNMCTALIMNWLQADNQIRRLMNGINSAEFDLPLLMQKSVVELSQCKRMFF